MKFNIDRSTYIPKPDYDVQKDLETSRTSITRYFMEPIEGYKHYYIYPAFDCCVIHEMIDDEMKTHIKNTFVMYKDSEVYAKMKNTTESEFNEFKNNIREIFDFEF